MSKVDILVAKIENGRYLYEKKQVEANRWIDIPPYATQQNVLIQDYIDNISLGWVQSVILPEKDGTEPFPVEWTVKSGKKQRETQDIS